jgi:transcriptional regulator with XRE-family HTH domain
MKLPGKKIKLLRHQKGWGQKDAANRLQLSTPAFSKIETGITDVNLSRLEQIASLFDISLVELLTDDEQVQTNESKLEPSRKRLNELETQIILLRNKVIGLYEEIQRANNEADALSSIEV